MITGLINVSMIFKYINLLCVCVCVCVTDSSSQTNDMICISIFM